MHTARDQWKKVQAILGTAQDGIPGPKDEAALADLKAKALLNQFLSQAPTLPAPSVHRVDERSEKVIETLLPPLHAPARQLVHQAAQHGIQIKLISGTRTYEEQESLYEQGRSKPGKIVTNAKPGSSWHNHGAAFDIGVFEGSSYIPESPKYRIVGQIGKSLGFEWGGDFKTIADEPHFQMTNGKTIAQAHALHGLGKNIFS